jgi:pSer/pThr/pTyr-binding forkhead associated (FHA) protein
MTAWLVALTDEAQRALAGERRALESFPFRVGRESRVTSARPPWQDRRAGQTPQLNDLYIPDHRDQIVVSREHFQIELEGDGHVLVDRGSACGTLVEGARIGGDREGGRAPLHDHDVIVVGGSGSPFIFKFRLE